MSFSGGGPSSPQMNVTPLIDVLLVLIIIFMMVVAQEKPTGEVAQVPQPAADGPERPERTIVIQVAWNAAQQAPTLKINRDDVAWQDLHEHLQRIFLTRAERVAFIKGDKDLDFQYVAEVINVARNSGVVRVGLLGKESYRGQ